MTATDDLAEAVALYCRDPRARDVFHATLDHCLALWAAEDDRLLLDATAELGRGPAELEAEGLLPPEGVSAEEYLTQLYLDLRYAQAVRLLARLTGS